MSGNVDIKKYLAELIGTFILVFMGCGSAVLSGILAGSWIGTMNPSFDLSIRLVGIAFAFGLSLLVMVYAIGSISGCHINPAVSISMLAAGKMKAKDTIAYIIVQCIGATIGALVLYAIASGNSSYKLATVGLGQNGYGNASPGNFSLVSVFIAEVVLTFIFLLVIHGSTSEKAPKGFAGISIGLSLVLIHLVGIPVDGTSVNPARSFGPAVLVGGTALSQLWLFWAAPIIGALLAAAVYRLLE